MNQRLITKARKVPAQRQKGHAKHEAPPEVLALFIAYARGEVTCKQACTAMGVTYTTFLGMFARVLRTACAKGQLFLVGWPPE